MNGVDQQIDELASSDEDRREPPGSISVCKWSDCVDTFDEQSKLIRHIHDGKWKCNDPLLITA